MRRSSKKTKALTLVELMMSLAMMSIIGVTVATVAAALSHAQSHTDEINENTQSARSGLLVIESYVRKAKLVTAVDTDGLAVWLGDANQDGMINIDELAMIRYDSQSRQVKLSKVSFPLNMSDAMVSILNTPKALSTVASTADVSGEFSREIYVGYLSENVLATDVDSFEVVPDTAPPLSRLVLLRIKVGESADRQVALTSSAKLRADDTANAANYEGEE